MKSTMDIEFSQFEGLTPDQQRRLSQVLDDYFTDLEKGCPPDRDELAARHPDLAAELAAYLDSLDFLHDAAVGFCPATEPMSPSGPAATDERRLGDFELVREIGRGGMGVVYEARQISLSRRVALKVLPFAALFDSKQIARFRNEAQAAAQLHHPNIVPVYAVGTDRGVHYYAMQLIDGQPLDKAVEEIRQAAQARQATDQRPDNDAVVAGLPTEPRVGRTDVAGLLTEPLGRPKVSKCEGDLRSPVTAGSGDPRRAKPDPRRASAAPDASNRPPGPRPDTDAVSSLVTEYSSGSPRYFRTVARLGIQAAQALHAAHEYGIVHRDVKPSNLLLDGEGNLWITDFGLARCRSDSHLTKTGDFVGTVRYMSPEQTRGDSHLVDHRADIYSLGVTLYELLTLRHAVRGDDPADILRHLDHDQPYRLRLFNANIPADLENIVEKAISKNRDERYESAQQLADDLRRFLDGKPTIAKRPSLVDRVGKWARRHKRAVLSSVGVLLLAVVALVVTTLLLAHQKQQTQRALAEARGNFRQYRAQLALTENNLALLQNQNGDSRRAEASFKNAIRLQREILAEDPADERTLQGLAATLNNLGFLFAKKNQAKAVQCYTEALRTQQRLVDAAPGNVKYQSDLALAHGNLGSAQLKQGKPELAAVAFRESIAVLERVRPSEGDFQYARDLAISCNNLGMTQNRLGELPEAELSFRRALKSMASQIDRVDCAPGDLSSVGGIHNNLAVVLEKQGRFEEAADSYSQAIRFQQMACKRAPEVARFRDFLSKHYSSQGRVLRSLSRYDEAVAAALARKQIWRGSAPHVWSVGEDLALIAQETHQLSPIDASAQTDAERFARQTIAVLQEAVDLGLDPAAEIPNSETLLALQDHPGFQAWFKDHSQAGGSDTKPATAAGQQRMEQKQK